MHIQYGLIVVFMVITMAFSQQQTYVVVQPNEGQRVHVLPYPNAIYKIIIDGNQTANQFTIVEGIVYMNEGAGNHYHAREDETFFVINGTLQFSVDDDQFCAPAGTTVYIPRNAKQSLRNLNSQPVHIQIVFAPSGIENYLEAVTPIFDTQPINYTKANETATQYGIVNLPPVEWKDLKCNANELILTGYFYLIIFSIEFYLFLFFNHQ